MAINGCQNNKTPETKSEGTDVSQNGDSLLKKYNLDKIKLLDGFKINVYAEVPNARSMCVSPSGTVFVGTKEKKCMLLLMKTTTAKQTKFI